LTVHWILQAVAPLAIVAGAAINATRRRVLRRFRRAGAFDAAHAIEWPFRRRALADWWRRRFLHTGVLRVGDGDRYWLDPPALGRYRRARMKRAMVAVLVVLVLFAIVTWMERR
jgi:hypothetical protein